jgi:hypothetical protein
MMFSALNGSYTAHSLDRGYVWLCHSSIFVNYKTYSILPIGVGAAALFGGYIGHQIMAVGTLLSKIGVGIGSTAIVDFLVTFLSLPIIMNIRGS